MYIPTCNEIIVCVATVSALALIFYFYPKTLVEEQMQLVIVKPNFDITGENVTNLTFVPNPPLDLERLALFEYVYADNARILEKVGIMEEILNVTTDLPKEEICAALLETHREIVKMAVAEPMPERLLEMQAVMPNSVSLFGEISNLTNLNLLNNYLVENNVVILGTIIGLTAVIVISYILVYYVFKTNYSAILALIKAKLSLKLKVIKTFLIKLFIK